MRDAYVKTLVEIQDDVRVLIGNLEKTLEETKTALFTQNLDKARMVRDGDDKFDEEIRSIMRKDLTVQVLQSPVASDWRSLMGTFRVLSELERIADHCSDMALYIARILERNPVVKPPEGFKEMYEDAEHLHTLPVANGAFKVMDTLYKNLQLMMLGDLSPEEAIQNTVDYAESIG